MARALAIVLWLITLVSVVLMSGRHGWFPEQISEYGDAIDRQFVVTLIVVGIAFVLAQVTLGYFVLRYRDRGSGQAVYTHGHTGLEVAAMVVTAVVFVILAFMGQRVWAQLHLSEAPPDAFQVEVTGQQFVWNIRYPGADGKFGPTKPELINDQENPVGIDRSDPTAKDDVVSVNRMAIPVNRPVLVWLRAKDVTHSFYVPALRLKQDTVPGMRLSIHFQARKAGQFEIACAELCGLGHYRMKGFLEVMSDSELDAWLKERASY
ncbi:MAG: cytochrome c oxidase subunit II [Acidobacteriota bacterium]